MRFKIDSTYCYDGGRDANAMKLITKYPCLKDFAFERAEVSRSVTKTRIQDENGNWIIQIDEVPWYANYITIDTIDQLMSLIEAVDEELVIGKDWLEIYDGYRE